MKKYKNTDIYNWEILSDDCYILWVRLIDSSGKCNGKFLQFSYYSLINQMNIEQSVMIECQTIDEANYFVMKVLRAYRKVDIPEEFQGRYFKLKKLQRLSKCQSKN